jgi:hypothetical protein
MPNKWTGTRSRSETCSATPMLDGGRTSASGTGTAGSRSISKRLRVKLEEFGIVAHQSARRGGTRQAGIVVAFDGLDLMRAEAYHLHHVGNGVPVCFACMPQLAPQTGNTGGVPASGAGAIDASVPASSESVVTRTVPDSTGAARPIRGTDGEVAWHNDSRLRDCPACVRCAAPARGLRQSARPGAPGP